jgi:phospholipid/cholesterol/gamma-HCH transport system permease protein
MYGNFFFWLFREPFPTRQLGQQFVRVILDGFGILAVAGLVEGAMFAWLGGWYGMKFSVTNWAGAASLYLLLSAATTLFGAMMFAAKLGTAFTVEIGSMQMSGQLDALRLMAVEPTQYIVIPRVLTWGSWSLETTKSRAASHERCVPVDRWRPGEHGERGSL